MKFLKFAAVTLAMMVAAVACAKENSVKSSGKTTKLITAEETLGIELAKDVYDPDKPKAVHQGDDFSVSLYEKNSLAWNTLIDVEKIDSGVGGYVFRLVVDEPDVDVWLEELRYWHGVNWYQPIRTLMEFSPEPHVAYEFTAPAGHSFPKFRLVLRKGDKVVNIPFNHKMLTKGKEWVYECCDSVKYQIDDMEPMSHLARVYAYWTALKGEDVRNVRTLYWRTIATSWSMVMSKDSPLDEDGYYHSTEWFFDEFAYALFPEIPWPDLRIEDHVIWFDERPEPYVIRRRTFDINDVKILKQWREDEQLVLAMKVKRDRGDRVVHVYMSPASLAKHPFAWKIEKGVVQ